MSKSITILGSTGTIGVNTLDIVKRYPERFSVFALTANTNVDKLLEQSKNFNPKYVVLADEQAADRFSNKAKRLGLTCNVLSGKESLCWVAEQPEVDMVMAAIVGAAGLLPNLAAVKASKKMLLANKESLVMSGQLFMDLVKENKVDLLPIDSEHNAIYQCLPNDKSTIAKNGIKDILLTASGGPFLNFELKQFAGITPEQAIAHPNWVMGKKISVDSATMMNKGLEVIEACWLFDTAVEHINVVIHPESIIHSMVRYDDGSVLAQMGNPDMRTPITYSMAWPERIDSGVEPLDLFQVGQLNFKEPDLQKFPCLRIAQEVATQGGTSSAIMNAANEIAVDSFLNKQIHYTDIAKLIEKTLEKTPSLSASSIENILKSDEHARHITKELITCL
jgi:1-deoxy-D-xylulose-5-phosphate reductoisomerase